MHIPFIFFIMFILLASADWAFYHSLGRYLSRKAAYWGLGWIVLSNLYILVFLIMLMTSGHRVLPYPYWSLTVLLIFIPKLVFILLWLVFVMPLRRMRIATYEFFTVGFLSALAGGVILYGGLIERFKLQVKRVELYSPRLPQTYDGYKLVQISDLHLGSLTQTDTAFIDALVDSINSLMPDAVCFTGDLVNTQSNELRPFMGRLQRLVNTRHRVYAVLGNHDYGDYSHQLQPEDRKADADTLRKLLDEMGWILLDNDARMVHHRSLIDPTKYYDPKEGICLMGVGNIGEPPFATYGDMATAQDSARALGWTDSTFTVLLSHNPRHWDLEVADSLHIDLTLSGHTHGMQMQVGNFSPAEWRYPKWGGLYTKGNQHLYVNTGAGTVGFPMRIGLAPEITLFTLRSLLPLDDVVDETQE